MKNFSIFAAANLIVVLAGILLCPAAHAQSNSTVIVKNPTPKASNASKGNWLKGEVIRADANSIIVREQDNGMMIHTFTYTPEVQTQMQKLVDQGGYQYGDKVKILYQQGQTVALKVRGKPSKAI